MVKTDMLVGYAFVKTKTKKKQGELFSETGLSCHKFLLRIQVCCYSRGLKSVPSRVTWALSSGQ